MSNNEAIIEILMAMYKVLSKVQQDEFLKNIVKRMNDDKDIKNESRELRSAIHQAAQKVSGKKIPYIN